MRYLLILIVVFSQYSNAQYFEEEEGLYSRFRPGAGWFFNGLRPYEEEKLRKYDRVIFDITYCDWQGDIDYFQSPWNSIGFNVATMFDVILTKKNTVSFGWGISFSHFSNKTNLQFQSDYINNITTISEFPLGSEPDRTKFAANYLEVPLEIRFRTKGYKHFKVMLGGKIGYQLNAFTKTTNEVSGQRQVVKLFGFPDDNPLRYGATLRIGIRNWAIYGAYYFSPLFTNSESVQLTPFTMGVSISLF
jgi:hypothetical protein